LMVISCSSSDTLVLVPDSRCVICSEAGLGNLLQLGAMAITANRGFSLPIFSLMLIICPFLVGC